MGERMLNVALVALRYARRRAGEKGATRGAGQPHTYPWIVDMDDHRGPVEQVWADRLHLVAGYYTEQPGSTPRGLNAATLVRCVSLKKGQGEYLLE